MKRSIFLLVALSMFFFCNQFSYSQTDIYGGDISGHWVLADSPYRIYDSITIPDDSTLTIEAGAVVEFQGHYSINVQGNIQAAGSANDSIVFTINDSTGFSNTNINSGGWNGIRIIDTNAENDSSIFEYCRFQYGKAVADYWHSNAGGALCIIHFDKVRISHCSFTNNSAGGSEVPAGGAIHLAWSDIKLHDNVMQNNKAEAGGAIQMHESDPIFIRNVLKKNSAREGGGISIGSLSNPSFDGDSIMNNVATQMGGGIMCWNRSNVSFTNLYVQGNAAPWGAGIGLAGITANFNECTIIDNVAENLGGGIASDFCNVTITNCLIISNSASMSGGVHAWYDTLVISNSEISKNSANYGGGIHSDFSQLKFESCKFSENTAINGGGVHFRNCDLEVDHCEFNNNVVQNEGGGIEGMYADTLVFDRSYFFTIEHSQFVENNAVFRAGGIRIEQEVSDTSFAEINIEKCSFRSNHAERVAGLQVVGGFKDLLLSNSRFSNNITDLWNGGASFAQGCTGKIINCEFADNQALLGNPGASGVSNGSFIHYINCTFANNTSGSTGGLSVHRDGKASVTNCIFWNNTPRQISVRGISEGDFSELYVNSSNIQYGVDSIEVDTLAMLHWGDGNIDSDPLFYDSENEDYHLLDESPCIDAGTDSVQVIGEWLLAPEMDIEGNRRPQEGSVLLDMGAFENQEVLAVSGPEEAEICSIKAYPNPFQEKVNLELYLNKSALVSIRIFNFLGHEVADLANELLGKGTHQFSWETNDMIGGLYICRIKFQDNILSKKIFLLP